MYLCVQYKQDLTLIDMKGCTFRNANSTLNFVMKERAGQGIGITRPILYRKNKKTICENMVF